MDDAETKAAFRSNPFAGAIAGAEGGCGSDGIAGVGDAPATDDSRARRSAGERGMDGIRSNADWLDALRSEGAPQSAALEDLRRYLLRALPNALKRHGRIPEDLVDDVVQDALLRVLDRLEDFEGRSRFTTWVVTIAVRIAMTELRRRRWRDVSLDALLSDDSRLPEELDPNPHSGPESRTARLAIVRALAALFEAELSPRQRTAIVSELRGMPQEEIGRRLGINRNAVYKLAYDGRKKLKRGLEASGFDAQEIRACFE